MQRRCEALLRMQVPQIEHSAKPFQRPQAHGKVCLPRLKSNVTRVRASMTSILLKQKRGIPSRTFYLAINSPPLEPTDTRLLEPGEGMTHDQPRPRFDSAPFTYPHTLSSLGKSKALLNPLTCMMLAVAWITGGRRVAGICSAQQPKSHMRRPRRISGGAAASLS